MKRFIAVIFATIFIACGIYLIVDTINRNAESKKMEEIQQSINTETQRDSIESSSEEINVTEQETETEAPLTVLSEYQSLYEENSDMCGWVKIDETKVNYPVMYTPNDPNFYLHHDWDKEDSTYGMIYIDERCDLETSDNLILYGHCMKNRTMFGSLREYKQESYYLEHPTITYDTLYEKGEYQVIAVFVGEAYYDTIPDGTFVYYNCIDFTTQDEFDYFYNNIKEKSMYDTGVEAEYGDKFITLSTCSYEFDNARTVVIAKKVN